MSLPTEILTEPQKFSAKKCRKPRSRFCKDLINKKQLNLVLITVTDMWDIMLLLSMQNSWETLNLKLNRADGEDSFNCYLEIKLFNTST